MTGHFNSGRDVLRSKSGGPFIRAGHGVSTHGVFSSIRGRLWTR
jgi:hypothetical protein